MESQKAPASTAGELRAYMAYERYGGPVEGAALVFAHTAREAKKLARTVSWLGVGDCPFTDLRVKLLEHDCAHLREKDEPHVIEAPPTCARCELWKDTPLDPTTGLCDDCCDDDESWEP